MIRPITSVNEFIQITKDIQLNYKPNPVQANISSDMNRPFIEYLISVSDVVKLQELTGIQRQPTDKSQEFILSQIDSSSMGGIKVNHFPMYDFHEYDKWEGGYIEGFLRTMTPVDYFIWTYAKMDKLESILNEFKHSLFY
jgi:hypothetical protein